MSNWPVTLSRPVYEKETKVGIGGGDNMKSEGRTILVVEDDENDVFFLKYAFETAGIDNPLQVVRDGQEALNYLAGTGKYADRQRFPLPCLVLLDLKLPVKMGTEVLRWIRSQPHLCNLLVIVLTSSSELNDVDRAYEFGAQSYLVKPLSLERRLEMAKAIKNYWLDLNEFPSPANSPATNVPGNKRGLNAKS